jgi:hypothetical protein
MRVAENLHWKGLKIKKSVRNKKIMMLDEVRHRIGKGLFILFLEWGQVLVMYS